MTTGQTQLATQYLTIAMNNAFRGQQDPQLGTALLVLKQMAAGLKETTHSPWSKQYYELAQRSAGARPPTLKGVFVVLQHIAGGLKSERE